MPHPGSPHPTLALAPLTRRAAFLSFLACLFVLLPRGDAADAPAAAEAAPNAPAAIKKPAPSSSPARLYEQATPARPAGRIDELVFARLAALELTPAALCTDAVFVRRVFLDVIGTLPTADETRAFLADRSPAKRAALIDALLEREEFNDYWAMKWSDLLRVKAEFPINLWPNAAQCYHRWIRDAVRTRMPLDQFARELLTANGSNFRVGPANFYRAVQSRDPAGLARTVALTFMGCRADTWPAGRLDAVAPFFAQLSYKETREWKEEIVFFNPDKPRPPGPLLFPDGTAATIPPLADPRGVFADWLTAPDNAWFAPALANRAWSWLLGRGIVQPVDDFRADNPPTNPALLTHLAQSLVLSRYDLRALFREILNSRTYQLSSLPPPATVADPTHVTLAEANFAHYATRRLDAEVLIDAINQITGSTEQYTSAIPEPFTFIPPGQRSITLPDGSITSAFLENFGRPGRDTGEEAERSNRITASQRLHLLNSTHVQLKLERGPRLAALLRAPKPIEELYLTILSRPPTADERAVIAAYLADQKTNRRATQDVAWALLNTPEFLHRH